MTKIFKEAELEKLYPRLSPDLYFSWSENSNITNKCYITKIHEDINPRKADVVTITPKRYRGTVNCVHVENLFFTPEQAIRFPDGSDVIPNKKKKGTRVANSCPKSESNFPALSGDKNPLHLKNFF